jgi:protocatechuate 3,4-dioxygenase beta subunit
MFLRTIFFFCLVTLGMPAQRVNSTSPGAESFQIAGSVIDAATSQPLADARVAIAPVSKRDAYTVALTGADGRFTFSNLSPGKYTLAAQHRGYLTQGFNQHGQFATSIATGPGLDSSNLVFRMTTESAISGTVLDDEGDGVRDAHVMLFQSTVAEGSRETRQRAQATTNDEGRYRFAHLPSGKYFVAVLAEPWYAQRPQPRIVTAQSSSTPGGLAERAPGGEDNETKVDEAPSPLDVAYPLTFYSGVTDASAATPILLGKGEKVSADIDLHPVPAGHIRLAIESSETLEHSYAVLEERLLDGTRITLPTRSTPVAPGVWEISGIPPGHYTAKINSWGNNNQQVLQQREVDVAGSGVIEKSPANLVPLSAAFRIEPPGSAPGQLALQLRDKNSTQVFSERVAGKGDIEFKPGVPPGNYEVSVQNGQDLFIQSIRATGARLTGRTLEIKGAAPVKVTVLVARGMGEVTGVALREGKPVAGAMIALVPPNPANNRVLFRRDQSDSDGTFRLADVVPGQYTLLAIEDGWDLEWANPGALKKFMAQGEAVTVEIKGKHSVKVKVQ